MQILKCNDQLDQETLKNIGIAAEAIKDGKLVVADKWKAVNFGSTAMQDPIPKGAIKVTWNENNFLFKFETDGSLTARQVL